MHSYAVEKPTELCQWVQAFIVRCKYLFLQQEELFLHGKMRQFKKKRDIKTMTGIKNGMLSARDRVVIESEELKSKIIGLETFISRDEFNNMSNTQRILLGQQLITMQEYHRILKQRLYSWLVVS